MKFMKLSLLGLVPLVLGAVVPKDESNPKLDKRAESNVLSIPGNLNHILEQGDSANIYGGGNYYGGNDYNDQDNGVKYVFNNQMSEEEARRFLLTFGGPVKIGEDGARIFTHNGIVYHILPDKTIYTHYTKTAPSKGKYFTSEGDVYYVSEGTTYLFQRSFTQPHYTFNTFNGANGIYTIYNTVYSINAGTTYIVPRPTNVVKPYPPFSVSNGGIHTTHGTIYSVRDGVTYELPSPSIRVYYITFDGSVGGTFTSRDVIFSIYYSSTYSIGAVSKTKTPVYPTYTTPTPSNSYISGVDGDIFTYSGTVYSVQQKGVTFIYPAPTYVPNPNDKFPAHAGEIVSTRGTIYSIGYGKTYVIPQPTRYVPYILYDKVYGGYLTRSNTVYTIVYGNTIAISTIPYEPNYTPGVSKTFTGSSGGIYTIRGTVYTVSRDGATLVYPPFVGLAKPNPPFKGKNGFITSVNGQIYSVRDGNTYVIPRPTVTLPYVSFDPINGDYFTSSETVYTVYGGETFSITTPSGHQEPSATRVTNTFTGNPGGIYTISGIVYSVAQSGATYVIPGPIGTASPVPAFAGEDGGIYTRYGRIYSIQDGVTYELPQPTFVLPYIIFNGNRYGGSFTSSRTIYTVYQGQTYPVGVVTPHFTTSTPLNTFNGVPNGIYTINGIGYSVARDGLTYIFPKPIATASPNPGFFANEGDVKTVSGTIYSIHHGTTFVIPQPTATVPFALYTVDREVFTSSETTYTVTHGATIPIGLPTYISTYPTTSTRPTNAFSGKDGIYTIHGTVYSINGKTTWLYPHPTGLGPLPGSHKTLNDGEIVTINGVIYSADKGTYYIIPKPSITIPWITYDGFGITFNDGGIIYHIINGQTISISSIVTRPPVKPTTAPGPNLGVPVYKNGVIVSYLPLYNAIGQTHSTYSDHDNYGLRPRPVDYENTLNYAVTLGGTRYILGENGQLFRANPLRRRDLEAVETIAPSNVVDAEPQATGFPEYSPEEDYSQIAEAEVLIQELSNECFNPNYSGPFACIMNQVQGFLRSDKPFRDLKAIGDNAVKKGIEFIAGELDEEGLSKDIVKNIQTIFPKGQLVGTVLQGLAVKIQQNPETPAFGFSNKRSLVNSAIETVTDGISNFVGPIDSGIKNKLSKGVNTVIDRIIDSYAS